MANKLTATDYKKIKMRERRKTDKDYKNHLDDLIEEHGGHTSPVGSYDENRDWTNDSDKIKFRKRIWRDKDRSKFLKKDCNKAVRNSNEETLFQGGLFKKLHDFWWRYW